MYHKPIYYCYRAAGGLRTLRYAEAFRVEHRSWFWSEEYPVRPPKMRTLPEEVEESNYGEWQHSIIKVDRWVCVRRMHINTWGKHRILYNRRQSRLRRQHEKGQ